jgi:hypothetical protein
MGKSWNQPSMDTKGMTALLLFSHHIHVEFGQTFRAKLKTHSDREMYNA